MPKRYNSIANTLELHVLCIMPLNWNIKYNGLIRYNPHPNDNEFNLNLSELLWPGNAILCHKFWPWLTHCGLVMPYGGRDAGQHWFWQWHVAWRHRTITWTYVDLPLKRSSDVQLRAILLEISQSSVTKISLKKYFSTILLKSPRRQWVK